MCKTLNFQRTSLEFDVVGNLAGGDINLNHIIDTDHWVGVSDGASVGCDQEWNLLWSDLNALHLAELVLESK